MVEVWELLTSQNHLAILLIIILHTAVVYGNTSAGNRLGQAFFRGQCSALHCQCKYWVTVCACVCVCMCKEQWLASLCIYLASLGRSCWPLMMGRLSSLVHCTGQTQLTVDTRTCMLFHTYTHTHAKRNIPTQPGSPCISLSDHVNKCRIHNSVYEFTKSPFTLSVYHTDQPLSALFITFSLWDATPRLIVSGWEAAISFCLWYLQGATELSLHVHLVSNGPCGATFHSVAGQGCTQALRLLILTERTCPFRDSWGVATQDCLLHTHTQTIKYTLAFVAV